MVREVRREVMLMADGDEFGGAVSAFVEIGI